MRPLTKNLKLSPRTKVRFGEDELTMLKDYIKNDPVAYANIKNNTSISRNTILRLLDRGWAELATALPLRDFIKNIKKIA